jgi:hypothetical protein
MKKLIGLVAFVTIGLFGYTHEAPSAQADNSALSSPMTEMTDSDLTVQAPQNFGCPASTPRCCEPTGPNSCAVCISSRQFCP